MTIDSSIDKLKVALSKMDQNQFEVTASDLEAVMRIACHLLMQVSILSTRVSKLERAAKLASPPRSV